MNLHDEDCRMNPPIEPHLLACFLACESACGILEILPDSDLIEELRNLLYIQEQLFLTMINQKHYGTDNITQFMEFTQVVKEETKRLKEKDNV